MNKPFAAVLIGATLVSGTPVFAQPHGRGHGHGHGPWKSHDTVVVYGGGYGYNGYAGPWRTGQRYPYYRDTRYVVYDYGRYGLPPPWAGYNYYRTNSGDIVMVAIASGLIGLIIGSSLGTGHYPYYPPAPAPVPVPAPPPPPVYYPPPAPYYPPYPAPYYPPRPYGY